MDVYDKLGVTKVVNGAATLTRLGGSLMPPEVVAAMSEAARYFVDMVELQAAVGRQIAEWTHNEAAFVSCGAAAGLALSAAACIAGADREKRGRLPYSEGMANEVIVYKHNRVGYDFAMRQAGAKLVEVGVESEAALTELEAAITDQTAAILYFYNVSRMGGMVPTEKAIEIAHRHDVPFIVDAAAQIPPVANLWRFTQMGADLVLFSGGKGLRGPQASGLILGRQIGGVGLGGKADLTGHQFDALFRLGCHSGGKRKIVDHIKSERPFALDRCDVAGEGICQGQFALQGVAQFLGNASFLQRMIRGADSHAANYLGNLVGC